MTCGSSTPRSCATSSARSAATCGRSRRARLPPAMEQRARHPWTGLRQARLRPATSPRMAAVDFDRQAIEKRDFPIVRRGYDPAAVDAHLRALAAEIEQLQREMNGRGADSSLASAAGTQVQSILQAAETAAADIESQARQSAANAREDADRDAARTRQQAIEQARAHVAAVAQATATLLERVASMDGEVGALSESISGGARRLAADLAAVETNMGELYDAASGRAGDPAQPPASGAGPSARAAAPVAGASP